MTAQPNEEVHHTAEITNDGGYVFVSLLDGNYIKMAPGEARKFGVRLFIQAAEALGESRPEVIVLR